MSSKYPSTALLTALITLLLFSVSVHSQSTSSLKDAPTSPHTVATESPSGSDAAALHKADSIVDAVSTTLKSVVERPEGFHKAATFGEKIAAGNATRSKLDDHQERDNPSKSEKLEVEDVAKAKGKLQPDDSLAEFDEKEDLDTHELEEDNDREPTTPRSKKAIQNKNDSPENSKEKEIETIAGSSEDLDFKEIEETKTERSLVNDTNVNYKKKTVKPSRDDGILENAAKDLKSTLENATNVIASGDAADTQLEKGKGPKAQVEVVKNSTLSKSQRIAEVDDVTSDDKKKAEILGAAKREKDTEDPTTTITGFKDLGSEKYKDGIKETVLSSGEEKTGETEVTKTLPSPKGRTISFGGVNEFVTIENKTRENAENEQPIGVGFTKEMIQEHKNTEFKPYPYVKTTAGLPTNGSDGKLPLSGNSKVSESTEEASALENTIGQRQQDKKFVVTESSVDLDNSIQQFKPTYFKRSGNASRIQSSVDSTSSTISPILNADTSSGSTLSVKSMILESSTIANAENLRVSNTENDVPLDKDEDKKTSVSIKETSSGLDLTGNGITEEVGVTNHSVPLTNDAGVTKPSMSLTTTTIRATEDTQVQNSTERIATLSDDAGSTNMDVQTDAEDSMLKMSPLNVTEGSTRIPSTESATSLGSTIPTSPTTSAVSASSSDSIELEELATTTAPDVSTDVQPQETLQPIESSTIESSVELTTPKVEYEFVGLTESTVSQRYIASSESPNAVSEDREAVSSTTSSFSEVGVLSTAATTSGTSSSPGDSSVDTDLTKETVSDQESSTEAATLMTEKLTSEDATTSISTIDFSGFEETTTTMMDNSEITTISDVLTTMEISEATETTTEEMTVVTNVTNPPDGFTDGRKNATDTGRAVDSSSTSVPDVSDKPRGNSSDFSTETTESSNLFVTTESPEVIETTRTPTIDYTSNTPSSEATITPELIPSTSQEARDVFTDIPIRSDIPSLVRIVFEGTWPDVCPHLPELRKSLAALLSSSGLEKTFSPNQIVFQKNPCTDGYSASVTSSELPVTSLLLYVVDQNGVFDSEMTKMLPALYSKYPIKFQVTIHSFQLVQDSDSGNAIAVVVVSCVAFICLVLLAGLLFIMRKRQTRFNYGERCRPVSLDAYSLDSVSAYNSVRRKGAARASKRSYGNPTFEDSSAIPSHPLNFGGLATFCNEQNAIAEEFSGIPQVTARIDELPPGAEVKNRYANVVPLPETRVSLMKINNDPLTEYINASYVRGPKNATKYYIACQAPIESTVTDFWRMIWEQQSKVIIMLTDLVENGVEKCAEYIPPSEVTDCHRLYGDFQVTLKKRETKEKYAISTLHLKNLENNTFREISHIWYLWPANGVQSDAAGLIAVLLEARALQRGGPGPIVVHCSPGTGRTGTLIALDLGIRQYEITRTIDVPRVVYTIRRDRAGAVQTKEQYAFIYKALNLYATKLAGGALES